MRFAITWRSEARAGVFIERYQKPENGILADKVMSGHSGTRSADKVSGQGGQHLVHATLFCLGRVYKVNNTFFRFCGCLFHILLVPASPFAGACFVFAGALFHILLVRASLFAGAYFVFAGSLFHILLV